MDEKTKSEDLYAELRKTLAEESKVEDTSVADDQKPTTEKTVEEPNKENEDLTEEEISKLHPKAQKRIKELADKVKELAEKTAEKSPESPEEKPEPSQEFKNVEEFLSAVQDKDSRNLLEKFYSVMKKETSEVLAPVEQANKETTFEKEFSKYESIEGVSDYKNDLKKTFLRTGKPVSDLVGKVVTDLALHKIKPIEKTPSTPSRERPDISNLSKEELYDVMDTLK